ncbi:MAG TPA: polysaccharide deacetylase family protein [Terriglobales bacterium]|nr:polysaccharide deacetylase family protein [Terriglobales bacterium]
MLRRLAKTGIAYALHATGADKLIGVLSGSRHMPLVIGYHRVVNDYTASAEHYMPGMLIGRRTLERHLDWLGRRYRFLSLDELGARLESGEPFDKPVAAITFDDGYADVYHYAFPLLKRKGIPSAVFVVTDLIGTARLQIYDKLYLLLARAFSTWRSVPCDLGHLLHSLGIQLPMRHLTRDPYTVMRVLFTALPQAGLDRVIEALEAKVGIDEGALKELHACSWEMLAEMQRAGVTIGSHTQTHALLTNECWHKMLDETAASRQVLERKLGITIKHFAYPNGSFTDAAVRAVAVSGYRLAYTTCLHRSLVYPLLTIPRKFLWENSCMDARGYFSPSILSCQAHRVFDAFVPCDQHPDWTAESPRSPVSAATGP